MRAHSLQQQMLCKAHLDAASSACTDTMNEMQCRTGCGACCIAPSITSPIPGMPNGKPAGVRCIQLDEANRCQLFGKPERPAFCGSLQPSVEMCGSDDLANPREYAIRWLSQLEQLTAPNTLP